MRTALDIDDDVLQAAKALARREKKTAGPMISDLARKALGASSAGATATDPKALHGVRPFPGRGGALQGPDLITMALVSVNMAI